MLRIAIYSRKSKFTGTGESIGNQIELCREYIRLHLPDAADAEILCYEDEGYSGKNTERPQFQEMLRAARKTPFDYIVCYRLDRISRSVGDFSALIESLKLQRTAFICIKEQFDTGTPMGRAMMYIASVFAQLERETIAERVRDNMYLLARTGRWLGGVTPTGFRSQKEEQSDDDDRIRASYRLIQVPSELETVRKIYAWFLESESISGVAQRLETCGIRSRGGKLFGPSTLKSILRNPVYAAADADSSEYFRKRGAQVCFLDEECDGTHGFMPYNRACFGKKGRSARQTADWIVAIGKHSGILCGADWVRVQRLLDEKQARSSAGSVSPVSNALLSGLLRCAGCGSRMRPRIYTNYIKKDGLPAYYYCCARKDECGKESCSVPNLNGYAAERAVLRELLQICGADRELSTALQASPRAVRRILLGNSARADWDGETLHFFLSE